MPGTRCAVALCTNSLKKTKENDQDISYHTFPKNPKLCHVWVNACQRKDTWNPRTSTICSSHFLEDDFEVDLRSKLMNIKTRRKLKPEAVPTKCLKENDTPSVQNLLRQNRANKRHNSTVVHSLMQTLPVVDDTPVEEIPIATETSVEEKYEKLLEDHKKLKIKYNNLAQLNRAQKNKIKFLDNKSKILAQKFGEQTIHQHYLEETLKGIFESNSIAVVNKKKKK